VGHTGIYAYRYTVRPGSMTTTGTATTGSSWNRRKSSLKGVFAKTKLISLGNIVEVRIPAFRRGELSNI
jgi:hypothetical protein